jgi:hypothetical protein
MTFDELQPLRTYAVGQVLYEVPVVVATGGFTWSDGRTTDDGIAFVDVEQLAGGARNDIQLNNISLVFTFVEPIDYLELRFGEYGGNLNIRINDDFRNIGSLAELSGQEVGGVTVSVYDGQDPDTGWLVLNGPIDTFVIGGQELWVDELCNASPVE